MDKKSIEIFKCLADQSRLNIVNLLLEKPMYVELLSNALDLAASTVSFHLKKMEKAGIVHSKKDQYYTMYSLDESVLKLPLSDLVQLDKVKKDSLTQKEDEYRLKVLKTFFDGKILKSIPVQRKKRVIVLEELAKDFTIGKEYTEKEVNEMILNHHEDFCTLRREFIMEKLFTREKMVYTRKK